MNSENLRLTYLYFGEGQEKDIERGVRGNNGVGDTKIKLRMRRDGSWMETYGLVQMVSLRKWNSLSRPTVATVTCA